MDGIRYRKICAIPTNLNLFYQAGNEDYNMIKKSGRKSQAKPTRRLLCAFFSLIFFCIGCIFVLIMLNNTGPFKGSYHRANVLDDFSINLGIQNLVHAVVIDAGSTGSRVLAFTFYKSMTDNSLKLKDELWHEVKPGLSSYKNEPIKGAQSLLSLIKLAKERIPEEFWSKTPLVVKATAGLRLIEQEKAEALIEQAKIVALESGFNANENSVEIMDETEEGIFSWFTVNYLLDLIGGPASETLVALDLGGGSTQVTFIPTDASSYKTLPDENLFSIDLYRNEYKVFTKSFLGLGLMTGRSAVLNLSSDPDGKVRSPCINPIIKMEWAYNGQKFNIKSLDEPKYITIPGQAGRLPEKRPIADFEKCYEVCTDVITRQVFPIKELSSRGVAAFSYFYDRTVERGLVDPFKGGVVKIKDILFEAKNACEIPNTEQPFACLDMTFISAFLHHGYGLNETAKIKLYKKIDNSEISWALGLAFHLISNGI